MQLAMITIGNTRNGFHRIRTAVTTTVPCLIGLHDTANLAHRGLCFLHFDTYVLSDCPAEEIHAQENCHPKSALD